LVLAAIALGSAASGLVYGAVHWQTSVLRRFRLHSVVFALLPILLLTAFDVPVLAVCAFVFGLGVAPALITMFGLVQQFVPARALTEGLSWIGTGLNVGYGAGAALVGGIADAHGARSAFLVVIGSSLPVGVLGLLLGVRRSTVAPAPDSPTPVAP
jgi:MFS family permease